MNKGAKALLIILALAVVALVAFLIYRKRHKQDDDGDSTTPSNGGSGASSNSNWGTATSTWDFPLKKGSRGEKVKFVQKYINWVNAKTALTIDGIWGANTELWARKTFLIDKNDNRSLEIDLADYNAMIKIWNFSQKNNLTYAQFSANYIYNYKTGSVVKRSDNTVTIVGNNRELNTAGYMTGMYGII